MVVVVAAAAGAEMTVFAGTTAHPLDTLQRQRLRTLNPHDRLRTAVAVRFASVSTVLRRRLE